MALEPASHNDEMEALLACIQQVGEKIEKAKHISARYTTNPEGVLLQRKVFQDYTVEEDLTVPYYASTSRTVTDQVGSFAVRLIGRHPLNARRQRAVQNYYKTGLMETGVMMGVRGSPWLLDGEVITTDTGKSVTQYFALTKTTCLPSDGRTSLTDVS